MFIFVYVFLWSSMSWAVNLIRTLSFIFQPADADALKIEKNHIKNFRCSTIKQFYANSKLVFLAINFNVFLSLSKTHELTYWLHIECLWFFHVICCLLRLFRFMFLLCVTPNIINGFHISSYVFFSKDPEAFYCQVPLNNNNQFNWTLEQYKSFAFPGGEDNKAACEFIDWNYDHLYSMTYAQALLWNKSTETPRLKSCLDMMEVDQNYWIHYDQEEDASIIPEWNLVCERKALKSNVQVALSIGKFVGASVFGILSDK